MSSKMNVSLLGTTALALWSYAKLRRVSDTTAAVANQLLAQTTQLPSNRSLGTVVAALAEYYNHGERPGDDFIIQHADGTHAIQRWIRWADDGLGTDERQLVERVRRARDLPGALQADNARHPRGLVGLLHACREHDRLQSQLQNCRYRQG